MCSHLATFVENVTKPAEVEARGAGFGGQLRNAESLHLVPLDRRSVTQQPPIGQLLPSVLNTRSRAVHATIIRRRPSFASCRSSRLEWFTAARHVCIIT